MGVVTRQQLKWSSLEAMTKKDRQFFWGKIGVTLTLVMTLLKDA